MQPIKSIKKCLIVISASIGLSFCSSRIFAQPPQGPPPPPPNPVEVLKKINPFKKRNKTNADKVPAPATPPAPGTAPATGPGQPPPPPPNPLDLFKKKKKDTVRRATPRHQS